MQNIRFPAQVLRGGGVLNQLGAVCATLGKRPFVLGGQQALAAVAEPLAQQLRAAGLTQTAQEWYGGECTPVQIERLAQMATESRSDVIIAVGGGKALDTGKAVAFHANLPVITVPTIAATCAAVTPLSIRYREDGHFLDLYHLPVAPAAVMIDSALLARSPIRWLAAGLGDTLAKWYEFRAIYQGDAANGFAASSKANSEICYQLISSHAAAACQAIIDQRATPEFEQALDAIFLFAGLTSLMSSGAHAAAAHALYEGFTVCDKTRAFGHGLLVGYGNLCLLALEQRSDEELQQAIELARACSVPLNLAAIAPTLSEHERTAIIRAALAAPDMANMPFHVTEAQLSEALARVDSFTR
ncbi:glycerol dehydrogenase [Paramixta manurensis]|uniref:Glycerol dehydrogenase n=1 Tax=Paramixta manurensis TaxID=2740817 RepID=A0A6M8UBF8_9GAMM|nr:glycerol dehydrogenase [Erwiniaceae bacterium PD-1]